MKLLSRRKDTDIQAKDAMFERWLAQQGTQFLPQNDAGWPSATLTSGFRALLDEGPSSYAQIFRTQPSVYTVVEFLAWQLSQIGIKVYQRASATDRIELSESSLARILENPAPGLTYTRFMHRTVADLCIFGNCYWIKLEDPQGRRVISPVPAETVTPRGGTLVQAETYDVNMGRTITTFTSDQIVHFRRYSPDDLRIGTSPLEPLRSIILEEMQSSRARVIHWKKSGRMDGLLERGGDVDPLSPEARERLREDWKRFSRGGDREGETALLEGITYRPISFSPKEMEFIAGRKLTLETVARAFNIPLSVLGLTETATYASQKEFHKALYQDTLSPWTRMIEDEIQAGIVPWFTNDPDVYVEFNLAEKLKGSFEEQSETLWRAVGAPWLTRNEARARLNLPRLDDPAADELAIPAGVTTFEEPATSPAPVVSLEQTG